MIGIKGRCFLIISLISLMLRAGFVYSEDIQERINQHYQMGSVYYQQGKYKEAQEEFQKALDLANQVEKKKTEAGSIFDVGEIEELLKTEQTRVNLEYKEVPLSTILQSLAYSYNLNIVPPKDIKERVTISLKDVTLDEALEAILISGGYSYYKKGNLIYIYPSVGPEEASLITTSIALKYLQAAEAEDLVSKSLSPRGDIRVNEATNSLIVRDYAPILNKIKSLLKEIDTPPLQVLIEAKIVDITSKDLQNLGVTYGVKYTEPGGLFKHSDSSYEGSDEVSGTISLAGPSSTLSGGQFKLNTFILKHWDVTATIDALVRDQKAHLLASPSIATLSGKEARIVIGEKVPYKEKTQTTTGTTETTRFVDVGVTLRVTPQVSPDGYITMVVHPEVSSVKALLDAGPQITTREADAVIRVKDGQTIVIGGLIKNEDTRSRSRIPLLGYLPIIGYLFGNKSVDSTQTELAVFITPHIMKEPGKIKKAKTFKREEVYVNISGVGERAMVNLLFEKAQNLELNRGIESRRKDKATRIAEALELYRTIASQFPGSDKADEALYRAGKIYYRVYRDFKGAKGCFERLTERYPESAYYSRAAYIVRSIQKREGKERLREK